MNVALFGTDTIGGKVVEGIEGAIKPQSRQVGLSKATYLYLAGTLRSRSDSPYEAGHIVPVPYQPFDQSTADEAGAPRNQNPAPSHDACAGSQANDGANDRYDPICSATRAPAQEGSVA